MSIILAFIFFVAGVFFGHYWLLSVSKKHGEKCPCCERIYYDGPTIP